MPGRFCMMHAVITAGGPIEGAFAQRAGTNRKALAMVRGRSMIERAIDALHGCGIAQIAVVGDDRVAWVCEPLGVHMVPDSGMGTGNILRALDAWPGDRPLLYLTCDMPYIDAACVQWVIERTDATTLSMPLAEHVDYVARFPGAPEAGITLSGERVVNGGVFFIPAGAQNTVRSFATSLFQARKAPWRMAAIAGPLMLLRFALGRASVASLESRARAVLGIPVAALRGAPPELAYDADSDADYVYALEHE